MGVIKWSDIPGETQKALKLAFSPQIGHITASKEGIRLPSGWNSVPPSWGICKKHGWAWFPAVAPDAENPKVSSVPVQCVFCEYGETPLPEIEPEEGEISCTAESSQRPNDSSGSTSSSEPADPPEPRPAKSP